MLTRPALAAATLLLIGSASAEPIDTWPITHGIDCVNDPYNPLDDEGNRDPHGDPQPGTSTFAQRDSDNQDCARQRSSDRRPHPMGPAGIALYGQDPYRWPDRHDGVRFRFDRPSIPGVPSVEVYRPCSTDTSVCPDLPAELERFDPPYPVVVVFHGFTASKELHRFNTQAFAEAGYLAIGVNGTHFDLGPLPSVSAPNIQRTENGEDVLQWLHAAGHAIAQEADLDRVAFAGHSQGSAAARAYQGDPRVHTIIAWDGGDAPDDLNVAQPMMFQRTDGGFATPSSYSNIPNPAPRLVAYEQLKERGIDVMHFTARATTHVDWNGNGGPGMNRLFELFSNYYNIAWLDRYLKGRLVLDGDGNVVATHGRTEVEERAFRQQMAWDGFRRLTADRFDDSADRHNISMGLWDPVQALESGDPLFGGNVTYSIEGLWTKDRFSYYYPSTCYLTVPDYLDGGTGQPDGEFPVAAVADTTIDGDMRFIGCPKVQEADDGDVELVATLSASPTQGDVTDAPLEVAFAAAVEGHAAANGALAYTFYFGDGTNSDRLAAPNTSHSYGAAGSFQAVVVVADEAGNSATSEPVTITTTTTVIVEPEDDLVADLKVTLNQSRAPATATFDASASTAPEGALYRFSFGDGSSDREGTQQIVTHTYTTPGSFTATVTVTDPEDAEHSSTAEATVTVTPVQQTTAQLTVSPSTVKVGQPVSFDATASVAAPGQTITSYSFDFGDGNTLTNSTGEAEHIYTEPGSYQPGVTVTDDGTETAQAKVSLRVDDADGTPPPAGSPPVPTPPVDSSPGGGTPAPASSGGGAAGLWLLLPLLLTVLRRFVHSARRADTGCGRLDPTRDNLS